MWPRGILLMTVQCTAADTTFFSEQQVLTFHRGRRSTWSSPSQMSTDHILHPTPIDYGVSYIYVTSLPLSHALSSMEHVA